jgi:small subunit ribosomal protein S21
MDIKVDVRDNNVDKALRILKKKLLKEGFMKRYKEKQYYIKPSERKKERRKESIRRIKKEQKLRDLRS